MTTLGSHKPSRTTSSFGFISKFTDTYTFPDTSISLHLLAGAAAAYLVYNIYKWNYDGTLSTIAINTLNLGAGSLSSCVVLTSTNKGGCSYVSDTLFLSPSGIIGLGNSDIQLYPNLGKDML